MQKAPVELYHTLINCSMMAAQGDSMWKEKTVKRRDWRRTTKAANGKVLWIFIVGDRIWIFKFPSRGHL